MPNDPVNLADVGLVLRPGQVAGAGACSSAHAALQIQFPVPALIVPTVLACSTTFPRILFS